MDWNGVIGSVASVINTALPLFFGVFDKEEKAAPFAAVAIGPATLYRDGGVFKIGNFNLGAGGAGQHVLVNFVEPPGPTFSNLSLELPFGDAFLAEPWLEKYTYGDVTIGTTEQRTPASGGEPVNGIWTFVTQAVLGAGNVITAVVNPTLRLELSLNVTDNVVKMTAIGVGGAVVLGMTWMLTARNNAGKEGSRSGVLERSPAGKGGEGDVFLLPLPTGIHYKEGIYGLQLQVPVRLSQGAVASDKRVKFEIVPKEKRAAMKLLTVR